MRLAVLADIHSNLPALESVLADVAQHDVQGILVAGDHFSGGPFPAETAQRLRSLDAVAIRGNTDNRILAYHTGKGPETWHTSDQWAAQRWVYERLDSATLDWLAAQPEQAAIHLPGTTPIRLLHGALHSASKHMAPANDPRVLTLYERAKILPVDYGPGTLERALAQIDEAVLICGHSHIAWTYTQRGRLAVNPGAVGTSNNDDPRAQYALLSWSEGRWQAKLRAVPYSLVQVRQAYVERGLLSTGGAMSRAYMLGTLTAQAVFGHFVSHVFSVPRASEAESSSVVPEEVWERAIASFDWATYERQSTRMMTRQN
jgi:putative phosphoesterase